MKLRVKRLYGHPCGYFYVVDRRIFPFFWETLWHRGYWVCFGNRTWANEYVRLYNAIRK